MFCRGDGRWTEIVEGGLDVHKMNEMVNFKIILSFNYLPRFFHCTTSFHPSPFTSLV